MSPTPAQSPKGAFIQSPKLARGAGEDVPVPYTGSVGVTPNLRIDGRMKFLDSPPVCAQNTQVSEFASGERTDRLLFTLIPDNPFEPTTLAEMRTWTITGVTSGAEYIVSGNTPTEQCDSGGSVGGYLFRAHYTSTEGLTLDPGPQFFADEEQAILHDASPVFATIDVLWNAVAAPPAFINGENVTIEAPA